MAKVAAFDDRVVPNRKLANAGSRHVRDFWIDHQAMRGSERVTLDQPVAGLDQNTARAVHAVVSEDEAIALALGRVDGRAGAPARFMVQRYLNQRSTIDLPECPRRRLLEGFGDVDIEPR